MRKILKNQSGFSLVEMALALFMGAMVVGVTSQSLVNNVDSYQFIANRKSALGDARSALNRISHELLRIETMDIGSINSTEISFTDAEGAGASFSLESNGDGLGLYRGGNLLVPDVQTFELSYYDENGNEVTPNGNDADVIAEVRRIKVTITTEPVDNEGNITLSTVITPRAFIGYNNYE